MRIIGEKIIIRDVKYDDVDDFFEYCGNEEVGKNAGWKPIKSKEIATRVIAGYVLGNETYAIALKDSNKFIGTFCIYNTCLRKYQKVRQIGFSLSNYYWNQGIMTEACKIVIDYLFNKTDCEVIEVGHHAGNYASKRVIEKCGFLFDGRLCKYKRLYDGTLVDADFYSLTREDYERMKKYEEFKH